MFQYSLRDNAIERGIGEWQVVAVAYDRDARSEVDVRFNQFDLLGRGERFHPGAQLTPANDEYACAAPRRRRPRFLLKPRVALRSADGQRPLGCGDQSPQDPMVPRPLGKTFRVTYRSSDDLFRREHAEFARHQYGDVADNRIAVFAVARTQRCVSTTLQRLQGGGAPKLFNRDGTHRARTLACVRMPS